MKHYVGLDLSMETTQVCIVDENGGKIASMKVESAPDKIAQALHEVGGVERAVIETGRMSPARSVTVCVLSAFPSSASMHGRRIRA